jgi:mRNA interferase MazF
MQEKTKDSGLKIPDDEKLEKIIDWMNKIITRGAKKGVEKYFREKEVWWAAMGKNIGREFSGKNSLFERPVLILKGYSKDSCFVLPFTSKIKKPLPWYQYEIILKKKKSAVVINQGRILSSERLLRKHSTINKKDYNAIVKKFTKQFKKK